jgi:hypothetical protein
MRFTVLAALAATAVLASLSSGTSVAGETNTIRIAQADPGARRIPEPAPQVVIEEPRPPRAAIETEGRGDGRHCRSAIAAERHEPAKVTDPERLCDPE